MTLIEVRASQESPQTIPVHEVSEPRDNAAAARRYFQEASDPSLPEAVAKEKIKTAQYLSHLALQDRIQEYQGKKKPVSR